MSYLVTGGTGFIGRFLIPHLLRRGGVVYLLVRESSLPRLDELRRLWGVDEERVVGVVGDLTAPLLGVSRSDRQVLSGRVEQVLHLAALYDLTADAEALDAANVEGTRQALELAVDLRARCFHHVSSIAVAGLYSGVFREDMLEEAEGLEHPYFRSKHEAERLVRAEQRLAWRIYRPGMVVGHSVTGECDRVDGPYHLFKPIQRIRRLLPPWVPLVGIEGGRLNLVPVDFVAQAIDALAHAEGEDGRCFHLTDPQPLRLGEMINVFCDAAGAPRMAVRIDARVFGFLPPPLRTGLGRLPPLQSLKDYLLDDLGIPPALLRYVNYPVRFDNQEATRVLEPLGIRVPPLGEYAAPLWDYWLRHLNPELHRDRTLGSRVAGKVCLVTGGTSGIGLATARRLAAAGAVTLIAARSAADLERTVSELSTLGPGPVHAYRADLADPEVCQALVAAVLADHGRLDILVNNAGRSIRRPLVESLSRLHDFERTLQLNYLGSLRLILGFLPSMLERGGGHIVNVSSLSVLTGAPRFSAYVASKAALDAFVHCAAPEVRDRGVRFTTVNMPLVRTPMIAPTRLYDNLPALSPEAAADLVVQALIDRSPRVAPPLGVAAQVLQALAPGLSEALLATAYGLMNQVESAIGERPAGAADRSRNASGAALAALMRAIHW